MLNIAALARNTPVESCDAIAQTDQSEEGCFDFVKTPGASLITKPQVSSSKLSTSAWKSLLFHRQLKEEKKREKMPTQPDFKRQQVELALLSGCKRHLSILLRKGNKKWYFSNGVATLLNL